MENNNLGKFIEKINEYPLIKNIYEHGYTYTYGSIYHNETNPSVYVSFSKFYLEKWYNYGKLHRETEPAYIQKTNEYETYIWYLNGLLHCTSGPAKKIIDLTTNTIQEYYYIDGDEYDQYEWFLLQKKTVLSWL